MRRNSVTHWHRLRYTRPPSAHVPAGSTGAGQTHTVATDRSCHPNCVFVFLRKPNIPAQSKRPAHHPRPNAPLPTHGFSHLVLTAACAGAIMHTRAIEKGDLLSETQDHAVLCALTQPVRSLAPTRRSRFFGQSGNNSRRWLVLLVKEKGPAQ